MIKNYLTKQLKINKPLAGHQAGSVISIKTDKQGTPIDRYWRDRMKDAKIDSCVEPVKSKKKENK